MGGDVRARYESRLGFRVGGKIVERRVDVGASVKDGQVLMRLDPQDLRVRVLDQQGVSTVTLVSDGYHNLRLGGIASEIGMDAVESPSSEGGSVPELLRETGLVALGRIIGYGRMLRYSP